MRLFVELLTNFVDKEGKDYDFEFADFRDRVKYSFIAGRNVYFAISDDSADC